jgi:hypothetical protein
VFRRASDVVAWLGAVQAQDYPAAKWALGLRAAGVTDDDVEQAFARGDILRTHVLRPTWHFVAPADIRWMLSLTGPRIDSGNRPYYRRLGLDGDILKRTRAIVERALRKTGELTRAEIASTLAAAGLPITGIGLAHVMMHAELEGVVCSGARAGGQFTYALLDARAPRGKIVTRDEALGELARRYFVSRGPASLRDFMWWSGLVAADARRGIEIAGTALASEAIEGRTRWSALSPRRTPAAAANDAHLLPNYDEYIVAYRDRDIIVGTPRRPAEGPRNSDVFAHALVIGGRLAGAWTKAERRDGVSVDVVSRRRLTPADRRALAAAVQRYGRFLQQAVTCAQCSTR